MILAGYKAAAGGNLLHRLIDAAMAVLKLVSVEPSGARKDLMPEADSKNRPGKRGEQMSYLLDEASKVGRITWPVSDEDAVGTLGQHVEFGMPRGPHHGRSASQEALDDAILCSDVYDEDASLAAGIDDRFCRCNAIEYIGVHV